MNSILVQHEVAKLQHRERLQQAERAHQAEQENSVSLMQNIAEHLVKFGEKLQESTPVSWSLSQPERHLVK